MSDHPAEAYAVAWALFHARCLEDADGEADRDLIDTEWAVPAMREFWLGQAQIALDALALQRMEQDTEAATGDVGWWVLPDTTLRDTLHRVGAGEDIELVLLEIYANADMHTPGGDD